MASNNLNVLMQKLYTMEKTLGPSKDGKNDAKVDEFNTIKQTVLESLSAIRKKMDEKDAKVARFNTNPEILKLGAEIKTQLQTLDKQLGQMNEVLRSQKRDKKRYGASELEVKEKQYSGFLVQVKELKSRERGVAVSNESQMKTLVEMKSDLMSKKPGEKREEQRELTAAEEEALERWKEGEKKQDAVLDLINGELGTLKDKAVVIGQKVDQQTALINNLDTNLDVAYEELESSNQKLKKVLIQYRKPGKLCMDICLGFVLMGLIGVIIKLL